MGFMKGLFAGAKDTTKCHYCHTSFQTLQSGFTFGSGMNDFGSTILKTRKGCDTCGVPVCFDCAAAAADRKGKRGQCICPKCGADLD